MRVLFTTWGWPSHFYPLVQLGWALGAAGHEVRVATQPGLLPAVSAAGLTPAAVGTDLDLAPLMDGFQKMLRDAGRPLEIDELTTRFGAGVAHMYVLLAENMLADTLDLARAWRPDLIVHEPTTFAGPLAAAALGVPSVRHIWGMDFTYATHAYEPIALRPLADKLGVAVPDPLGQVTVDPCPPSLQDPHPIRRLGMRYVPYNGNAELARWLWRQPEKPRVCVTAGTVAGRGAAGDEALDSRVVSALDGTGYEIVVVAPDAASPLRDSAPEGVRIVDRLAMHLLLPTCSAVVHAGGGGLAMTALATGTPQLVVPLNPDHIFNGRRLAAAGAAESVHASEASAEAIHDHVVRLVGGAAHRDAARRLSREMAEQPPATEVVRSLAELAAAPLEPCHAA
jgi:UDP:flavonoid glycosyltransferase YjiC (YdhE family)